MNSILEFKNELNDLQGQIMEEWFEQKSKRIGVSIQTDLQPQNPDESHTRTKPTNPYCQHWVDDKEHIKKCDRLDIELKEELNKKKSIDKSTKGLACRCHKGISNFVHKIKLYNINWYIYYGQFILSPLNASHDVIDRKGKDNYNAISDDIVKSKLNELGFIYYCSTTRISPYIKENPITTRQALKKNLQKRLIPKVDEITLVDLFDFLAFKDFVEIKFIQFLDNWNIKDKNVLHEYAQVSQKPLDILLIKFASSLKVQKDNKRSCIGNELSEETIRILENIILLLENIKSKKLDIDHQKLRDIVTFAELEDDGQICTTGWVKKSTSITELLTKINVNKDV